MTASTTSAPESMNRVRRLIVAALGALALGAVLGVLVGIATPAHVQVAGSDTRVWLRFGQDYDQLGVNGVVSLERPTPRAVLGEPLGIRAVLDLDVGELVDGTGQFNADVLPAYIQAYSDPQQLIADIRRALVVHLVVYASVGAGLVLAVLAASAGYRRWRRRYDAAHWPNGRDRARALAYRRPERVFARRVAVGVVVVMVLTLIPSAGRSAPAVRPLVADSLFNGTPLEGARVDGLLRPALLAAQDYIRTYFGDTDAYYDRLQTKLDDYLTRAPVILPTGDDIATVGFVTDRHCNIGMDRVVVRLLQHLDVTTLVSAGDDAFSGSFGFEAACTRGLADRSRRAGITDVFAAGNHDSAQTVDFEQQQGIKTLTGQVVAAGGLRFIGSPDPRTSRYGQGIVPSSSAAQHRVVRAQGAAVAKAACATSGPLIAVLHDPLAGSAAVDQGCGRVTLALDGHLHVQGGPYAHTLPNGAPGFAFTGATSGGAPADGSIEQDFASRLTVGPLHHVATVYLVSIARSTGTLVGFTAFRFTPDQDIAASRQTTG